MFLFCTKVSILCNACSWLCAKIGISNTQEKKLFFVMVANNDIFFLLVIRHLIFMIMQLSDYEQSVRHPRRLFVR